MENRIRKLYIEATSRCNLACKMCFRQSWIGESYGDLDSAAFARVMEDPAVYGTETVFFGGMGEPLAHPMLAEKSRSAAILIWCGRIFGFSMNCAGGQRSGWA